MTYWVLRKEMTKGREIQKLTARGGHDGEERGTQAPGRDYEIATSQGAFPNLPGPKLSPDGPLLRRGPGS